MNIGQRDGAVAGDGASLSRNSPGMWTRPSAAKAAA
jgi:hypothetical protein